MPGLSCMTLLVGGAGRKGRGRWVGVSDGFALPLHAGEACGTVHCEVLEEMGSSLGPGAVMLLRQVSVVTPRPRRHHLNITAANLVALYPAQGGRQTTGERVSWCMAYLSCHSHLTVM